MIKHKLLKLDNVVHGFFSAHGGVSKSPYKSLNCSFNNGDVYENVKKNIGPRGTPLKPRFWVKNR